MAAANVPMTAMGTIGAGLNWANRIIVGTQSYYVPQGVKDNMYWLFVLDLVKLQPVVNELYPGGSAVPPSLAQYANKPNYLLVLITYDTRMDNVPQGDFYTLLKNVGSGHELRRWEQMNTQMGTGTWGQTSYILAATMDYGDPKGFELFSLQQAVVMTFQLMPVQVGSQTIYIPIAL